MNNTKGVLAVISGPSGVGKGTIVAELMKKNKRTALSVSCTTRAPREGETDGISYFFISKQTFKNMIDEGGFLEYSEHFDNYYGTPRFFVEEKLKTHDVILEIEVDGALNVKKVYPEAVLIMVVPPSRDELVRRLKGRGTEDEAVIAKRLARADYELSKSNQYDHVVINDDLNQAVEKISEIIESERKGDKYD
ncbi:MAG: guanylate kinase [Candidatus Coproplasma sp.]